jgi:GTPase SAR1 family protein
MGYGSSKNKEPVNTSENATVSNDDVTKADFPTFKVQLVGDPKVGKTTFLKSVGLIQNNRPHGDGDENGMVYTVNFLAKSGPVTFIVSDGLLVGPVDVVLYMYDITDSHTFMNLLTLKNYFFRETPGLVLGNKLDMSEKRDVQRGDAALYGMRFLEVSAKTGENVQLAFESLTNMLL